MIVGKSISFLLMYLYWVNRNLGVIYESLQRLNVRPAKYIKAPKAKKWDLNQLIDLKWSNNLSFFPNNIFLKKWGEQSMNLPEENINDHG